MIRRSTWLAVALLAISPEPAMAATMVGAAKPANQYNVTDYGAIGDGQTLNTKAIQSAIDRCAADGVGVVVVPKGTFLSGALFLKPGVNLRVEKDGMLKGSNVLKDYLSEGVSESARGYQPSALINAEGLTNVTVSGEGVIDGNGERWWTEYWQLRNANDPDLAFKTRRPRLLRFTSCRQVRVADLKLQNQAVWCLHFMFCENVLATNLTIRAGHNAPSSDGIDVDSTSHALLSRCDIDVNDDCISIKAGLGGDPRRVNRPSQDIAVENCRFGYGHGGVAIGSETFGGIRNVEVRNCVAEAGNWAPVRFKTNASRGGVVENIVFRNITVRDVRQVFEVNMAWKPQPKQPAVDLPVFRNLQFINITGTANSVGTINGLKDSLVQNIKFEAVKISAQRGLTISNARDLDLSGLAAEVKEGQPIVRRTAD